jgi:hypothetical protein
MSKSFVTLEQKQCIVCGETYDSGALLLDKRMREKFEMHTVTGLGLCEEHQKMKDDGYVALIGCDEAKSGLMPNGNISPENAHRTGTVIHMRAEAWERIMNVPVPEGMICFCGADVIEALETMKEAS